MRTRLFLRTAEFLWQEGHTAHETQNEAIEETKMINDLYAEFAENFMSMPVLKGIKSKNETFAGAETTYCIEALMQDGKALQAGTSHFLGQNFAKAFDVKFADREGKLQYVWATSWGVSSRLMGALIMTHSDDHGLVLPPKLAPFQVVIVPIYKNEDELNEISSVAETLKSELIKNNISVKFDARDTIRPGQKFAQHEIQGVPIRIAIGPKDLQNKTVEIARRDNLTKDYVKLDIATDHIIHLLDEIQSNLHQRALKFRDENITRVDTFVEFKEVLENKGGFISAHWDGSSETENKIKELTKATIRCIPESSNNETGNCVFSGNPSSQRVLFAKAY
jgi:prolyl-tRNA synthetase